MTGVASSRSTVLCSSSPAVAPAPNEIARAISTSGTTSEYSSAWMNPAPEVKSSRPNIALNASG